MKPSERCINPNVFVRGELIRSATVNVTALAGALDEFDARVAALESKDQPIGPSHDWRRKSEESTDAAPTRRIQWRSGPVPEAGWYLVARVPDGGWSRNCYNAGHPCPDPWIPCKAFESPRDAVCARDAADFVRPTGHPLGQPEPNRRECWMLVSGDGQQVAFSAEKSEWPTLVATGATEHHLVEIRDGEQIVHSGYMVVPMGSVVLSAEQAERIVRAVHGGPVESGDLRALGIEVES